MAALEKSLKYWAGQVETRIDDDMHKLAHGTTANYRDSAKILYRDLTASGMDRDERGRLYLDVKQITAEHIQNLAAYWRDKIENGKMSVGYAQNLITSLRQILNVAKNETALKGEIPVNSALGISDRNVLNSQVQAGKISESTFVNLENKHLTAALALQLSQAYGLRREEAAHVVYGLSKGYSAIETGGKIKIKGSWSKNGRERTFAMRDGGAILNDVRNKIRGIAINYKIESYLNKINYAASLAGKIQREHITPHSLRHNYAQERYKSITGLDAPKAGGLKYQDMTPSQQASYNAAAKTISEELGHSRAEILQTYIGK